MLLFDDAARGSWKGRLHVVVVFVVHVKKVSDTDVDRAWSLPRTKMTIHLVVTFTDA